MSYKLELAIWSCATGQRISCFDSCQLIITWTQYTVFINGLRAERSGLERMKTRSERLGLCLLIERLDVESYLGALLEGKNTLFSVF